MPALCSILNSAYYANNYAGIFDAGPSYVYFIDGDSQTWRKFNVCSIREYDNLSTWHVAS